MRLSAILKALGGSDVCILIDGCVVFVFSGQDGIAFSYQCESMMSECVRMYSLYVRERINKREKSRID